VDRLEQVIDRTPDNLEAYRMQFQLLNTENCREEITSLLPRQPNLGPRVDEKMWRNFQRLDTADSSFELENKFVDYMFWRDMEIYAAPFIYQRLFDSEKKFLWWKFSLRFRYVCALFHAGLQLRAANRPAEAESYLRSAQEELGAIKTALFNAHSAGLLKAEEREQYFGETRQLELLLATLGLPSHAS